MVYYSYDENGYIDTNAKSISFNNLNAKQNNDGSYTINFSNNETLINFINIKKGWNYTIRMYEPDKKILNGEWTFPSAIKI